MAKYKVVSRHEVLGHKPGEVFEAELSESHNQLIGVGHLALVIDAPKAPPAPAAAPTSTPKEA